MGHSKSTFVVEGERGILKKWTKKKIARFFKQQTESLLTSCLAVAKSLSVLSLVQDINVFFCWKDGDISFSFNVFSWTCKYFYCHCIYNYVKNIDPLCWVSEKINSFLSFHSLIFHSNIDKRRGIFFWEGGNSLKQTYVEGEGIHVKRTGTNKGEGGGQNFEILSKCTFWMSP